MSEKEYNHEGGSKGGAYYDDFNQSMHLYGRRGIDPTQQEKKKVRSRKRKRIARKSRQINSKISKNK